MNAREIWNWLSGKKRTIAEIYWGVAVPAVTIVWPEGAPAEVVKVVAVIGLVLTYLGLGHAAVKQMAGGLDQ